jgi:TolA-binding protein
MKRTHIYSISLGSLFWIASSFGQSASAPVAVSSPGSAPARPAAQNTAPVSYASVTQLNGLLGQLESTSKSTQGDLTKLRIERWKTDGAMKKQALENVDSIQRNLQGALPEIISQLRAAPEDVPATFKLYRNLDALYDVLGSVVESTGAFGSKDDLQSLSNDLSSFESTRKQLAERIQSLSAAKEAEIARLRTDLKAAQAEIPAAPPKKIVVDDNEPAKKPVVKKKTTKPATTDKPSAGQTPPAQTAPTKPQ